MNNQIKSEYNYAISRYNYIYLIKSHYFCCRTQKTDKKMETKERTLKNTHHGHAIKRIRHTLGIKQEVLADMMRTTQARISNCEQKKELEDEVIDKFAKALNVAPKLIKELEEDPITVIIENNRLDNNSGSAYNYIAGDSIINNPIDKIAELFEKLLEKEQEKIALLERLLKDKK